MRRGKRTWDFHDYLELRRARDRGDADADADARLAALEHALPVPFADAIPVMTDPPRVAARAYPRGLTAADVRFMFEVREEYARLGATRRALGGAFDLNTGADALKDWLDFVEADRRAFKRARTTLRGFDARIHAAFTGERRLPTVDARVLDA